MDSTIFMLVAVAPVAYFFPSLLAFGRGNRDTYQIFLINLWLGWTVVGWITALQWAMAPRIWGNPGDKIGPSRRDNVMTPGLRRWLRGIQRWS